ncbi:MULTISPECIES: anti-sigma factor [unclassified Streptomyces]|uniref:anti-sigma factor family protein n=1 Tax=unclassified Streptomyces TaxID=2593676 RepID=UPI00225486C0|nr:anti-sigma factor [Streptomyces sp. NBC_00103]MCX5372129.1 anti-sigma factor [Streptomyces sp. NBC_00103]
MTTQEHSHDGLLGAHALGLLDADERSRLEEQIEACEVCQVELADLRALEAELGEVPPEFFLEGPPEDGELLLRRTLRQAREEEAASRRRRGVVVGLAVAALAGVLLGGGYVAGQAHNAPDTLASRSAEAEDGAWTGSATDSATRATMKVSLTPATGRVLVDATVGGLQPGEKCRLVVLSKSGEREIAGSWVVGERKRAAQGEGLDLSGFAAVPMDQVKSVTVENDQGKRYVEVAV